MGVLRQPLPVKLFVGLLSSDPGLIDACSRQLAVQYGPADRQSVDLPWDHSDYYQGEMGPGLLRRFIVFSRTIDPGELPAVKLEALRLERAWGEERGGRLQRRINIDPGYVTEAKVVLATTKDFPHRVHIGSGVYAESTLHYVRERQGFQPLPHTYPDFRADATLQMFNNVRMDLRRALQRER